MSHNPTPHAPNLQLTPNPDGQSLKLHSPAMVIIPNWTFSLEVNGTCRAVSRLTTESQGPPLTTFRVEFRNTDLLMHIALEQTEPGHLRLRARISNPGRTDASLNNVALLDAAGPLDLGGEDTVCLPLPGHISPRFVYRLDSPECPAESKIKTLFFERSSQTALLTGFLSFHRNDTVISHSASPDGRLTQLRATCDFSGWKLPAGQTTPLENFEVALGNNPYRLLETWADNAARLCRPRQWEDVPIGWLGWAWVDAFNVENYEETILRNCRAIRERLPGHDIRYVWLSIGNLQGGNPGNWLQWDYHNLPSGPRGLIAKLRELGFKLGLWCAPFYVSSMLEDLVRELDDALLRKNGQRMVVRPEWSYGDAGKLPRDKRPCMFALDPSHPKSHAFVRHVFQTYREWGIRYYMVDFLNAGSGTIGQFVYDPHHDRGLVAGPEAYQSLMKTIRQAAGDDTYLLSSSGPMVHNAGVFDAIRTGNDFGEGRQLSPDSFFYPATYVINGGEFWTGPTYALRNQACAYYTHRKLYINDSGNVLTLDSPLPLNHARVHATIHTLGASPAMLGDDVDRMEQGRLEMIRKTLPRPRNIAVPIDLFETTYPDHPKVFVRHVNTPDHPYCLVAVYNLTPHACVTEVPLADLGITDHAPQTVWEFWNETYCGLVADTLRVNVPPGDVKVLRLTPDRNRPHVLGTNMHITMGEMELEDVRWDQNTSTLSGTAIRPTGEKGSLFIRAPKGWTVANPKGVYIAKDAAENCLICKIRLAFKDAPEAWSLTFTPPSP